MSPIDGASAWILLRRLARLTARIGCDELAANRYRGVHLFDDPRHGLVVQITGSSTWLCSSAGDRLFSAAA